LEVRREGALDTVLVNVERERDCARPDADLKAAMTTEIKSGAGISVQTNILAPGTLARSQGKAVRVIDHR